MKTLNMVAFLALMQDGQGVVNKSPEYIAEKFERYCLTENNTAYLWGLDGHNRAVVDEYAEKWGLQEIVRDDMKDEERKLIEDSVTTEVNDESSTTTIS